MGLFSLTQELAIDLGTANTLIIYNGKVVVDEPSIVALDVHTGKLVAIGQQARQMHEKTNPNIKTIRPLKDGVIADFNATELMLRGMIKKVKTSGSLFAPSLRMVICIPSGSTNVEIRAVRDSAEHAGGREVYMIYEPMAAALGAGLDVEAPEGNMVIDIGGGTSEIACISLGGIVCSESINTAGDVFTNDIQSYVRQQHNIRIGERTAEAIKCSIGAAVSDLEQEPEDFVVTGPNMLTALPQTVSMFWQPEAGTVGAHILNLFSQRSVVYIVLYALLILAFAYFYASIQFNPIEIANNLKKNGGFIPGFRPGKPTSDFITKALGKVTFVGAVFLGIVALVPLIVGAISTNLSNVALGGTSVIIVVGVALDTVKQMEAQMLMRHHKGFLE